MMIVVAVRADAPSAERARGGTERIEASSCAVLLGTLCAAWNMFFIPWRSAGIA